MRYSLRYISFFMLGMLAGWICRSASAKPVALEVATEVYKEVAHIAPTQYANATLIYTDTENDVAYYIADERLQNTQKGEKLLLDNGECVTVVEKDLHGFYVDVKDTTVRAGMSGTPIWKNNEIIGYVSSLHNQNILYCIWAK